MFSAARCWYMFKYFGHPNVKMLDGGLTKWISENKPIVSGDEAHQVLNKIDFRNSKSLIFQSPTFFSFYLHYALVKPYYVVKNIFSLC